MSPSIPYSERVEQSEVKQSPAYADSGSELWFRGKGGMTAISTMSKVISLNFIAMSYAIATDFNDFEIRFEQFLWFDMCLMILKRFHVKRMDVDAICNINKSIFLIFQALCWSSISISCRNISILQILMRCVESHSDLGHQHADFGYVYAICCNTISIM